MNLNQNTKQVTFEEIKQDPDIRTYIKKADESLIALGFTEHSFAHVGLVAENSRYILETLGYPAREVELAQIAGYLHDIGNLVNRIEVLAPVYDDDMRRDLLRTVDLGLHDTTNGRLVDGHGTDAIQPVAEGENPLRSQEELHKVYAL